ncbi:MAG: heavy metal-binding domain-containing protein [Planctomycetota bacterium]|jgi:uncharacterized protein YbjQ (UPF0145 family)
MATIDCPNCGIASRAEWGSCPDCGTPLNAAAPQAGVETPPDGFPVRDEAVDGASGDAGGDSLAEQRRRVIVTTTPGVEGHEVIEHIGPVSAVGILAIGALAEWATNARAWFEEGPKEHVQQFAALQDDVASKLQHMAVRRGGNAVIGTSIDIQFVETAVGQSAARKLVVSAAGTAVRIIRA